MKTTSRFTRVLRRTLVALTALLLLLATVVASQWRADIPLATLTARWALPSSHFIEMDGMHVHYSDEGTGPVVLLLHGTSASLHTWNAWADVLHSRYRVVRVDLPAFGLTGPRPDNDYSLEGYVSFLEHFVSRVGLIRFALGGNSLGGQIAWRYALIHSEAISSLILVDSAGFALTGKLPMAFRLARVPVIGPILGHLDPRRLVGQGLRRVYGDPSKVTTALIDRYTDMALREGNRTAFVHRMNVVNRDLTSQLGTLHMPTLILWGRRDVLCPVENATQFEHAIPGAELHIYDDLGHVPMEEDGPRSGLDALRFLDAHNN